MQNRSEHLPNKTGKVNHMINSKTIPCDREKVNALVNSMYSAKVQHLHETGQTRDMRFEATRRNCLVYMMPGEQSAPASASPLGDRKDALAWTGDDDAAGLESGFTLLFWVARSGDAGSESRFSGDSERGDQSMVYLTLGYAMVGPLFSNDAEKSEIISDYDQSLD